MAKILVADDSIIIRKNLKGILEEDGHQVVAEASDGEEAYLKYKEYLPDLVTMDISMPGVNGVKAIEKIVSKFPEAKIIIISGVDQRSMVFRTLGFAVKDYIIKPLLTDEKIKKTVNKVLAMPDEEEI